MTEDTRRHDLLMGQIREVLLRNWDPLSVGRNPHLADEYDDYVASLIALSESSEKLSVQRISDALERFEGEWIEVFTDYPTRQITAKKVFDILVAARE